MVSLPLLAAVVEEEEEEEEEAEAEEKAEGPTHASNTQFDHMSVKR